MAKKKAPVAPKAPVVEALKADWEEHLSDPNGEPAIIEPVAPVVELPGLLNVKNQKGKHFTVSKDCYLSNKHKLTIVDA